MIVRLVSFFYLTIAIFGGLIFEWKPCFFCLMSQISLVIPLVFGFNKKIQLIGVVSSFLATFLAWFLLVTQIPPAICRVSEDHSISLCLQQHTFFGISFQFWGLSGMVFLLILAIRDCSKIKIINL